MKRAQTGGGGSAVIVGALGVLVGLAAIAVREWPSLQPGQGAVLGGTAVLGAALVTFYSQHQGRVQEAQQHAESERRENDVALRERYAKIAEQFADQSPAIRLAGAYALGSLADDWLALERNQEWRVCLDLMKAYLRVPETFNVRSSGQWSDEARDAAIVGEREVRRTTLRLACIQVRTYRIYLAKVGRDRSKLEEVRTLGPRLRYDFSPEFQMIPQAFAGAFELHRLNLSNCNLSGLDLNGLDLSLSNLCRSDLTGAFLIGTNLSGVELKNADLTDIHYNGQTKWPEGFSAPPSKNYQDGSYKPVPRTIK